MLPQTSSAATTASFPDGDPVAVDEPVLQADSNTASTMTAPRARKRRRAMPAT